MNLLKNDFMDLKTNGYMWTSTATVWMAAVKSELVHFNGVDWYLLVPRRAEWQDGELRNFSAFPKFYQTDLEKTSYMGNIIYLTCASFFVEGLMFNTDHIYLRLSLQF